MSNNPLKQISELGQSLWYDNIERSMIEEGELARLVAEDQVVGVTSNPSIFQRAISGSQAYDEQIEDILAENPTIKVWVPDMSRLWSLMEMTNGMVKEKNGERQSTLNLGGD